MEESEAEAARHNAWPGSGRRQRRQTRMCVPSAELSACLHAPVQVCLLDLEYGLPVQVRDAALAKQNEGLPQSDAGREYALQRMQVSMYAPSAVGSGENGGGACYSCLHACLNWGRAAQLVGRQLQHASELLRRPSSNAATPLLTHPFATLRPPLRCLCRLRVSLTATPLRPASQTSCS